MILFFAGYLADWPWKNGNHMLITARGWISSIIDESGASPISRFNGDTIWLKFNGDMMGYASVEFLGAIFSVEPQPRCSHKDAKRTVWWRVWLQKMRKIRKNGEATWNNWECLETSTKRTWRNILQRGRPKVARLVYESSPIFSADMSTRSIQHVKTHRPYPFTKASSLQLSSSSSVITYWCLVGNEGMGWLLIFINHSHIPY